MKKYLEKYLIDKLLPEPVALEEELKKHLGDLPTPVVWLLGKAQSGKSSIVQGVTGVSRIEIGEGFRPCTRNSHLYSFPEESAPFLRFLDTRGLEEASYDPEEDIAFCQEKSHLLLVVVRVDDHAIVHLLDTLKSIRRRSPSLPIVLALTCLHESYDDEEHILPYPYRGSPNGTSTAVWDHIERHRRNFAPFTNKVVAIDFTKEEDNLTPRFYGLEELLSTLETALPEVAWNTLLESSQRDISKRYSSAAHPTIIAYSLVAGSTAAIPLPLVDIPLVGAIQMKMLHSIARLHNKEFDRVLLAEVVGALGLSFVLRAGGREALKVIPGGSLLSSFYTATVTYGLGQMFSTYLLLMKRGYTPSQEEMRQLYYQYVADGTTLFERYKQRKSSAPATLTP